MVATRRMMAAGGAGRRRGDEAVGGFANELVELANDLTAIAEQAVRAASIGAAGDQSPFERPTTDPRRPS